MKFNLVHLNCINFVSELRGNDSATRLQLVRVKRFNTHRSLRVIFQRRRLKIVKCCGKRSCRIGKHKKVKNPTTILETIKTSAKVVVEMTQTEIATTIAIPETTVK
jgi:hypothetical protein